MTILEVDILLHYYSCCNDYRDLDAPAIKEAIAKFVKNGIMGILPEFDGVTYYVDREIVKPYINAITSIPLPIKTYVIPPYEIKNY